MIQDIVNYINANLVPVAAAAAALAALLLLLWLARLRTRRPPRRSGDAPGSLQLVGPDGRAQPLAALPATLGRAPGSTVVLNDPAVYTTHARLYFDEVLGAVCVEDCDSTNGVYVDGQPTRKNVLHDSARLTVGATTLTFRDAGYVPPPRREAPQEAAR